MHLLENAWEEWPKVCHADVFWPPSELIRFWSWSDDSLILAAFWLRGTGQNCDFRAPSGICIGGMAWNLACWFMLTAFKTDYMLVTVCWFSFFKSATWRHAYLTGLWRLRCAPGGAATIRSLDLLVVQYIPQISLVVLFRFVFVCVGCYFGESKWFIYPRSAAILSLLLG